VQAAIRLDQLCQLPGEQFIQQLLLLTA